MGTTFEVDLSDFLDEYGDVVPLPATAQPIFEQLTAIIVMASYPEPDTPPEYQVSCRRRPERILCHGIIQADIDPETAGIAWWCPVCMDAGIIRNWQGTIWDMSDVSSEH